MQYYIVVNCNHRNQYRHKIINHKKQNKMKDNEIKKAMIDTIIFVSAGILSLVIVAKAILILY